MLSCSPTSRYERGQRAGGLGGDDGRGGAAGTAPQDAALDSGSTDKTCLDVGKGIGIDSCCNGQYCNGYCTPNDECGCKALLECPSNTICCSNLGCSSEETCNNYLASKDGGS